MDAAGNIYVVDGNNNRVVEIARNTAGLNFANTDQGATSSDSSQTVTLRNIGNKPLAITAISYPADFPEAAGASTDCASSTPLAAAETCTLTIDFSPMAKSTSGTSQTLNEKVTLTDNTMNIKGSSQSASLSGEETNILPQAATPTFSVAEGTYTSPQTVTLADATTGAAIYYSTNGSQPTIAYTGPITVSASETITAVALLSDYTNSTYATATYTINIPTAATPTISPVAGTFTTGQTVTISDTTSGAAIYYTTDGSAPTAQSTLYASAISVGRTETIKAIAVAANYINSAIASAAYTIIPLGSPDFTIAATPSSLTITGGQSATLSVSVTPQNAFASAVSLTCAGLPAGATCTFAPATVTPSGTTASTTTLTVTTAAATAMYHRNSNPLLPASTLAVAFCLLGWKKRRNMQLFLLLAVSVIGMSLFTGCGGSTTSNHTQPVTSVVTVTGISGTGSSALHNAATFSLTVN